MKYFRPAEFDCRCKRGIACNAAPMNPEFLQKLDALREHWGAPLSPTSGRRCKYRNDQEGGAPMSQHLLGNACDFMFDCPGEARHFAAMAEKFGFTGIGLGSHMVHIDNRTEPAHWTYP